MPGRKCLQEEKEKREQEKRKEEWEENPDLWRGVNVGLIPSGIPLDRTFWVGHVPPPHCLPTTTTYLAFPLPYTLHLWLCLAMPARPSPNPSHQPSLPTYPTLPPPSALLHTYSLLPTLLPTLPA